MKMNEKTINPLEKIKHISQIQIRKICIPILLGQILAVLISLTAICNGILSQYKINLPLAINFPHYFLLAVSYGIPYLYCKAYKKCSNNATTSDTFGHNGGENVDDAYSAVTNTGDMETVVIPNPRRHVFKVLLNRLSLYSIIGIIDVHANWSIVSAYAYTTVTSIQLLDCITIPTVVFLSYFFLYYRYTWNHYLAIILCLVGATGMVLTDYFIPSTSFTVVNVTRMHDNLLNNTVTNQLFTPQEMVFGDFLVIIGGVAYAASNVLQQYLILKYGITEFLCCVGLVASVTTLVYTIIFEQQAVSIVFLSVGKANLGEVIGCFVGYALSMFLLYSLMPFVLARSSAVLVNLSLLTADIYAVLMGVYIFHYGFHYLYILCFLAILFGVCLFNVRLPVIVDINKRQTSSFCQSILRRRRRLESNKQHFDRQQIG